MALPIGHRPFRSSLNHRNPQVTRGTSTQSSLQSCAQSVIARQIGCIHGGAGCVQIRCCHIGQALGRDARQARWRAKTGQRAYNHRTIGWAGCNLRPRNRGRNIIFNDVQRDRYPN